MIPSPTPQPIPATRRRCLIATSGGRSACATCGEAWDAREVHVCPARRGARPDLAAPMATAADIAVLVAMVTRRPALVRKPSGAWWLPGWNAPDVSAARVSRLDRAGLIAPGTRDVVRVLTPAGRSLALNACEPETRARLAS